MENNLTFSEYGYYEEDFEKTIITTEKKFNHENLKKKKKKFNHESVWLSKYLIK